MAGLMRPLKIEQRLCVMKAFHIDETAGAPALAVGAQDGTLTDNGVGDYTITFTEQFARAIGAQVCVLEDGRIANAVVSATDVQVKIFQADGATAEDADCYVWVMGSMADDEV